MIAALVARNTFREATRDRVVAGVFCAGLVLLLATQVLSPLAMGEGERLTVDLSDLDQSTLNLVTGEAGNFLSPYYMDQWKAWYEGYTFKLPFSSKAVAAARQHELLMEPK